MTGGPGQAAPTARRELAWDPAWLWAGGLLRSALQLDLGLGASKSGTGAAFDGEASYPLTRN